MIRATFVKILQNILVILELYFGDHLVKLSSGKALLEDRKLRLARDRVREKRY